MSAHAKPELISFRLCPFVQRSVITLLEKRVDFAITYIDLAHKPAWFTQISPLGKVPLLRVGDAVLFESAVINEYLDEVYPPPLHPADPLRRAHNRAWIEFASGLIGSQFGMMVARDEAAFAAQREDLVQRLCQIEGQLGAGPYFNGAAFSLMDAACAPVFMRLSLLERMRPLALYDDRLTRVQAWGQALGERESVRRSVVPEFPQLFREYLQEKGSVLAQG